MTATWITGDTLTVLRAMPAGSVDLVMTSPPFLALRSYLPDDDPAKADEIGQESTPGEFLDVLLDITEELRRVLAPHGSICVELGDTYAGSGGAGGDYADDGLRDGQPAFSGSASRTRPDGNGKVFRGGRRGDDKMGAGWPEDKSLCLIPELYRFALAYGFNPLTGRQTPRWRVRNVVRWVRPNPPVGALGDKFRPGTSDMVIATGIDEAGRRRYFDLDAVREPSKNPLGVGARPTMARTSGSDKNDQRDTLGPYTVEMQAAGAPPLDWLEIPTAPYKGSHYATYPPALCERPIKAMSPQRVCTTCGEPSRRIISEPTYERTDSDRVPARLTMSDGERPAPGVNQHVREDGANTSVVRTVETIGWTDCGHGSVRCSSCKVLVPYDHAVRGSREATRGQGPLSEGDLLGEPVEGSSEPPPAPEDMRGVRRGLPRQDSDDPDMLTELFGEAGTPGRAATADRATVDDAGTQGEPSRLRPGLGAGGHAGTAEERLHDGAPAGNAGEVGPTARAVGDRSPSQRRQGRQPAEQPRGGDEGAARGHGDVPELPAHLPGELGGYVCPCGSSDVEYVADHWRPGLVLDPFGGSGTTIAVATGHGRDAIGIDLDKRNAELARERIGPMLFHHATVDELWPKDAWSKKQRAADAAVRDTLEALRSEVRG